MKITIKGTPEELSKLLQTIEGSKEKKVPNIQPNLTIDGNKIISGNINSQELASQLHQELEGIQHRLNR
ncbi:MAG: hypothetical protein ACLSE5_20200 [Enterococcus avium]